MIPFYLITGFLGSGKTTLLKHILDRYSTEKRIAVIQNEFAPAGIDGTELKLDGNGFKLVEVNNGSVFCVCMLSHFIQVLDKVIQDYDPELILLEASGLSDPINILELIQTSKLDSLLTLARIITIIDAPNFLKSLGILSRTRHQVMIADSILVNKTDLMHGNPDNIRSIIKELNPFAGLEYTTMCQVDLGQLIGMEAKHDAAIQSGKKVSQGRPDIKACVWKSNTRFSTGELKTYIERLGSITIRLKGFVNLTDGSTVLLQVVFGESTFHRVEGYSGPTEIVGFGVGLTPRMLKL